MTILFISSLLAYMYVSDLKPEQKAKLQAKARKVRDSIKKAAFGED